MTDNEIIKALDICGHLEACADCPLGCLEGVDKCMHTLLLNALDLINRKKAEIEDKSEKLRKVLPIVAELKAEAIKEFAERLKERYEILDDGKYYLNYVTTDEIDNIVKEMTEEQK